MVKTVSSISQGRMILFLHQRKVPNSQFLRIFKIMYLSSFQFKCDLKDGCLKPEIDRGKNGITGNGITF